jgi:hypothetical protein
MERSGHEVHRHLTVSLKLRGAVLLHRSSGLGLLIKHRGKVSFYTVSEIGVGPACRKGEFVSFLIYSNRLHLGTFFMLLYHYVDLLSSKFLTAGVITRVF